MSYKGGEITNRETHTGTLPTQQTQVGIEQVQTQKKKNFFFFRQACRTPKCNTHRQYFPTFNVDAFHVHDGNLAMPLSTLVFCSIDAYIKNFFYVECDHVVDYYTRRLPYFFSFTWYTYGRTITFLPSWIPSGW